MRKVLLLVTFIACSYASFSQDPISVYKGPRPAINLNNVPEQAIEKGRVIIKFKKELASLLKAVPQKGTDGFIRFNIAAVDALNVQFKVDKSFRSFESILSNTAQDNRHKAWGFDRWYELNVPANIDIKRMVAAYSRLSNYIEVVEPVYAVTRHRAVTDLKKGAIENPKNYVFNYTPNDPRFTDQWHYSNTGQAGGTAGKDINLPQAWDLEKGQPGVIVAVIDQGIDYTHPDIAANMWPGIGYNFVNNTNVVEPGNHGTHTAGTVAAVTNNNVGVSGVAGGDGTAGSGARLMSLEVFGPSANASNFGAPFIWAADNGAMIAQNSWSYTNPNVYQQFVLDGIDYFIKNGGGTVLKGGVVIFSAGNSASEELYYPAAYEKVLSVAATNNRDVLADYSNFGTWVDISAPGGQQAFAGDPGGVLSTVTVAGGSYAYYEGTSMACPHVSGVAALIASHAPGRFSGDDIRSILMATVDNHYPNNLSTYAGKMGAGRLNAFKALQKVEELIALPPVEPVTALTSSLSCPNVQLNWTRNAANNDVLIAYSSDANFGIPTGNYVAGDKIAGGGTVVFKGNAVSFSQSIPKDSASVTYKVWSVTAGNAYSAGVTTNVKTPFSLVTFSGNIVGTTAVLNWTKKCPNTDVIIATNSARTFGKPSGVLNAGSTLPGGGTIIYKGPLLTYTHTNPINGTNYYRMWTVSSSNDYSDVFKDLTLCLGSVNSPVVQGFESATFPAGGWEVLNPDALSITWERTTLAAKTGVASATMRFYDYSKANQVDFLISPGINSQNADSVIVSFDLAYRYYDATSYTDSLELLVSTDCGSTYKSVWIRGGTSLATVPGAYTDSYVPIAAHWANKRFDIKPLIGNASQFKVAFRAVNMYGQNLYLDNINIYTVENGQRDATVTQILNPTGKLCVRNFTPRVQIRNQGKDTLKTVKVMYRFGAGALDSVTYNGSLPIGGTALVDLKAVSLSAGGSLQFVVYTKEPNGQADQVPSNDTAKQNLTIFDPLPDPIREGFESASFPPNNWFVASSGSAYTWERTVRASKEKTASAWIRNYRFNSAGKRDDLYSPVVQITAPDSVYLKFDLSSATGRFPGSTGVPMDTLEVLMTTDCGTTFRSVYKKWGEDLSTVDKNFPSVYPASDTVGFVPNSPAQWRTEWLDVTKFVSANAKFQFVFRSTSNKGSNLFLDNIEISTVTLPAKLKQAGFLIAPNPFDGFFMVRHVIPPANLRAIRVMNSTGQVVAARSYNGNAGSNITIDMSRYASGLYNVELIYSDKSIRQTIIKRK